MTLIGLAAAALMAGCGDDEEARRTVVAAAERTTAAGPLAVHQVAKLRTGENEHVELRYAGTVDGRARTLRTTITTTRSGEPSTDFGRLLDGLEGELARDGDRFFARVP